jgi:ABC-type nitrate/sulfonate/bicarbonate transport system permease component
VKQAKFDISQKNMFPLLNFDHLVKSLILPAPQAILEFLTRPAKSQELGQHPQTSRNG